MDVAVLIWLEQLYAAVGNPATWPCIPGPPFRLAEIGAASSLAARHRDIAQRLHLRLLEISARLDAFARVLDQLPHPVVVVDAALQVPIVQQRARA